MIPTPTASRLARLLTILDRLLQENEEKVSSSKLAFLSGYPAHTIRKDINHLGNPGENGAGYEVKTLHQFIKQRLNLSKPIKAVIVGLGRLGSSILSYPGFENKGIEIVAGFDSSLNKIEQMSNAIPLHPSFEIEEVVQSLNAELGIIATPAQSAQKSADRLVRGGVKGILNFASATLRVPSTVLVRNLYVADELLVLATQVRSNKTNFDTLS